MMEFSDSVTKLTGVGKLIEDQLSKIGIITIGDLVDYLPRRYKDFSKIIPIKNIKPGMVTIEAEIKQANGRYMRRSLHITEAVASDATGSVRLVWFNQPYRAQSIRPNTKYYISGVFEFRRQRLCINNPSMELVSDYPLNTARIVPVYGESAGVKSNRLRKLVKQTMPLIRKIPETLPEWLLDENGLIKRGKAYEMLHFPSDDKVLRDARRRFGFEEVFRLSLASLLNKQQVQSEHSMAITFDKKLAKQFVSNLPFKLTNGQRKAIWQIYLDMQKPRPMNRLLEGDVGSGKTVVAAMAALMTMHNGFQVAFMAPTELLALQHIETLRELLLPLDRSTEIVLLIGSMKTVQKQRARESIKSGKARFIIGTHALIDEKIEMQRLGLVMIDEQHKFGVEQRKMLQTKAGHMPHVLSLTATPIPRSLALTLYGELDISVLDEKPHGRLPVITKIKSPNSRPQLYREIDEQIESGRQVFVVCPLIASGEKKAPLSAEAVYEQLKKTYFKHRRVGLLHGKLAPDTKRTIMEGFMSHALDILISTTVIEVGVDIPNATVILIEGPERFGLAQIHQLRGRVGRSTHQGYCYLIMSDSSAPSRRLRALETSSDGFELAEMDLEIRGPGAIYGTFQHGPLDLKVAKLSDTKLISAARSSAEKFINRGEDLLKYKELSDHVKRLRAVTNLN